MWGTWRSGVKMHSGRFKKKERKTPDKLHIVSFLTQQARKAVQLLLHKVFLIPLW